MLARLRGAPALARGRDDVAILGPPADPGEERLRLGLQRLERHELGVVTSARRDRGVGQDDDRRLEALARVHGQHPHAVALGLEIALDLRLVRLDLGEKARHRRRLRSLVQKREREELVDRVGGVRAEPRDQRLAAAVLADEAGIERVGAERLGAPAPLGDSRRRGLRLRVGGSGERRRERARLFRPPER